MAAILAACGYAAPCITNIITPSTCPPHDQTVLTLHWIRDDHSGLLLSAWLSAPDRPGIDQAC